MEEALCQALQCTFGPNEDHRKAAEDFLTSVALTPTVLQSCINIVNDSSVDGSIRLASAVYLKNEIKQRWLPCISSSTKLNPKPTYSDSNKTATRDALFGCLASIGQDKALKNVINECVRLVVLQDFPDGWPTLNAIVLTALNQRSDTTLLYAGLLTLKHMCSKFEYSPNKESMTSLVTQYFPIVLQLGSDLQTRGLLHSTESTLLVRIICKIYWTSTQMALAEGSIILQTFDQWMTLFRAIITAPIPDEVTANVSSEELAELTHFKAKKWALQIVHRLVNRYGLGKASRDKEKVFATTFGQKWSPVFMQDCLHLLETSRKNPHVMSGRMENLTLRILGRGLESASLYKFIKPSVPFVLFEVVFPLLCYTNQDVELWQSDPVTFVRSKTDAIVGFYDPKEGAVQFLGDVTRLRTRDFLDQIVNFVQSVLVKHMNSSEPERKAGVNRLKDGALCLIGNLAPRLTSKKRQMQIEPFLTQFVFPEFDSSDPFLRYRACWIYRRFFDPEYTKTNAMQTEHVCNVFKMMLERTADVELPVRQQAGECLQVFFELEDARLKELVKSSLKLIIERLFALMQDLDSDGIVSTLRDLVVNFEDQMPACATTLVGALVHAFTNIFDHQFEDRSDEDGILTAMTIASTLQSILWAIIEAKSVHVLVELIPGLLPFLDRSFSPTGLEFMEDGLTILTYLTFHCPSIDARLWKYYERMYQSVCGGSFPHLSLPGESSSEAWAPDYLNQMVAPLDNFISRDLHTFVTGTTLTGIPYKKMVVSMAEKVVSEKFDPTLPRWAFELIGTLFESFVGNPVIDDLMVPSFQIQVQFLRDSSEHIIPASTRASIVVSWCDMILYNIGAFLALCQKDFGIPNVVAYCKNMEEIKRAHGLKVALLALCKMFQLAGEGGTSNVLAYHIDEFAQLIALQTEKLHKVWMEEKEASSADCDFLSVDSEQDLDEDQDVGHESAVLPIFSDVDLDSDDDDDIDYEEDDDDDDEIRKSPLDAVDEVAVLMTTFTMGSTVFERALGSVERIGTLRRLLDEISSRKAARTTNKSP